MPQKPKYLIFKNAIQQLLQKSFSRLFLPRRRARQYRFRGDKCNRFPDLQPVLVNLPDYVLCQFIENIIMPVYIQLMSVYYYN